MTLSIGLEELEAEARYHRERLALYRARAYSSRPTTFVRMQELERLFEYAERRLRRAQRESPSQASDAQSPSDRLDGAESVTSGAS
jgi:hypothetical protein